MSLQQKNRDVTRLYIWSPSNEIGASPVIYSMKSLLFSMNPAPFPDDIPQYSKTAFPPPNFENQNFFFPREPNPPNLIVFALFTIITAWFLLNLGMIEALNVLCSLLIFSKLVDASLTHRIVVIERKIIYKELEARLKTQMKMFHKNQDEFMKITMMKMKI